MCCPQNLEPEVSLVRETQIFFSSIPAFVLSFNENEKHVVRICKDGEQSTFILNFVAFLSAVGLLLKLVADVILYNLTSYTSCKIHEEVTV